MYRKLGYDDDDDGSGSGSGKSDDDDDYKLLLIKSLELVNSIQSEDML